jgi:MHS family proline/betaine transporter-like MFS transporter
MMVAMPPFSAIGWAAPVGILLARLLQGFSAGGEMGGATAFMMEHAIGRAGFFASFQFTSQAVSSISGAGVAWLVSASLAPADLAHWGFRIPFAIGLLIGPVGLYLRRHVDETPVFRRTVQRKAPAWDMLFESPFEVLLAAGLVAAGTAATYIAIYLPTYAQRELHIAISDSYAASILGSVVALIVTPIVGGLSDRTGRFKPMGAFCVLLAVISIPAFVLLSAHPDMGMLLAITVLIGFLRAAYTAPMAALMAELFPAALRAVGMSAGYSLGVMAFGGLAPFACDWLIAESGDRTAPGWYLLGCSLISVGSIAAIAAWVKLHGDD